MKILFSFLVVAAAVFGAVGCGSTRKSDNPVGSSSMQSDHGSAQSPVKGSQRREGS